MCGLGYDVGIRFDLHQWHHLSFGCYSTPSMRVAPGFYFAGFQYNTCIVPVVRRKQQSGCLCLVVQ